MRWSRAFIPTLRDNPANAESPSHRLLIRAGFVRQLAQGMFSFLPLGQRTLLKIAGIIREEMNAAGAQEFHLPALPSQDHLQGQGRRAETEEDVIPHIGGAGPESPEEIFAEIARRELRSYRDLPQLWYGFHTKSSDEARPGTGMLRLRQYCIHESYSFDAGPEGAARSYDLHREVYGRILRRCGLQFACVEAGPETAAVGRVEAFLVPTDAGEEFTVSCTCGYAAKTEYAISSLPRIEDPPGPENPREVYTPGQKTIADVSDFLKVPPSDQIKSLVYAAGDKLILFLVRGDHQMSEAKAVAALNSMDMRPAQAEEICRALGADAGSLGPVGVTAMPVYADLALKGRQNLTCGANRNDYHLQGVTPDVHFKPVWADLRLVRKGESCVHCGDSLDILNAAEAARISRLGTKNPESPGATILGADGRQTPIVIGKYAIGLERIMALAVEQHHDADGIIWPASIAPFDVVITPVGGKEEVRMAAERLYGELESAGCEVLLDDREERPGVKFKDADLAGIPFRIVLGREKLKNGKAELFVRTTKQVDTLDLETLASTLQARIQEAKQS